MKRAIAATVVILAGCATPTTGIVPVGNGYYTVAHQGNGAWVKTNDLKAAVLSEANAHCEGLKKSIMVVNVKEIPAGPFGRWPEAEAVFACQ